MDKHDNDTPHANRNVLVFRSVTYTDVDALVAVHSAAFPRSTMTRLGSRFLRKYYRTVLDFDKQLLMLAEDHHGEVKGFVAGFADPPSFYSLFRKRRLSLIRAAAPALVRRPRLALESRGGAQWAATQAGIDGTDWCELASIAVHPDAGSMGIGSALVRRFSSIAFEMGVAFISLTTDANGNDSVQAFYEHLGFQKHRSLRRGEDRVMVEYRLYPGDRNA